MQSGAGNVTNLSSTFTPRVGGTQSLPASEGEITLQDVVDTVNPLQHIPFVSTLFNQFTDSKPSTGSRLAGGALYGGPIGFVASLANVLFEGITGSDVGETVIAALGGDKTGNETIELASNEAVAGAAAGTYQAAAIETVATQEILPPERATRTASRPTQTFTLASAAGSTGPADARVLDLYGGSQSANRAYSRAQMRPYLQDVSQGMVL